MGGSAVFGAPPKHAARKDPGAELARRFLGAYGPARPKLFADWAGLAPSHAAALWERAGGLVPVDLDGTKAWVLAKDRSALVKERKIEGVRLLPNLDPLNTGRDRELLVADAAVRKRIWTVLGGPGNRARRGRGPRPLAPGQEGQEAAHHGRAARASSRQERRTSSRPRRSASPRSAEAETAELRMAKI